MVTIKEKIAYITSDDSIMFIENLTKNPQYTSIFDDHILKFYKQMHDSYGAVFLLPLFYSRGYNIQTKEITGWNLSQATDRFKDEFTANSHWLKFGFHSLAGNVRYSNSIYTDTDSYDYSRNMLDDVALVKAESDRFAGESVWEWNSAVHFYDFRRSDAEALYPDWQIQMGLSWQTIDRGVCGYLNLEQQQILKKDGLYNDPSNGILHVMRPIALERINGTLKIPGTPNRAIDYLDYYNHRAKDYMNPETHEVQFANGPSVEYPCRTDLNDFCAWCNMRGYTWKFPVKSDFDII